MFFPGLNVFSFWDMDFVDVVEEKLKVEEITDKVSSASCGAVSLFIGKIFTNILAVVISNNLAKEIFFIVFITWSKMSTVKLTCSLIKVQQGIILMANEFWR